MQTTYNERLEEFNSILDKKGKVIEFLNRYQDVEIAEVLQEFDNNVILDCFEMMSPERQGEVFSEMDMTRQLDFFKQLSKKRFSSIFECMYSDSRADFFQHLTQQEQAEILPFLNKSIAEDVILLSAYPPETAGGIMGTDFTVLTESLTCRYAIEELRSISDSKDFIYYIYIVDENMHLKGFLSLKKIIQSDPDTLLKDIYESEFVFSYVDEDQELVAAKVEKYDLVALPILNSQGQLIGVVFHDDIIEVIRKEHTEDMEKFMGIVPGEDVLNYDQTSVGGHFKKRVVWLAALAVLGLISGIIIHSFEEALTVLIILAMYIPMVADTGGNAGSQAATVVIRALALKQLAVADWLKIVWKEARIAFLLAIVLGVIAFGKVLWLSWNTVLPPEHNLYFLAFGISLALSLQVITSTVVGACLPLIVKKFGGDPAVAASPAITTTVDITGLLIYFGIAMVLFF